MQILGMPVVRGTLDISNRGGGGAGGTTTASSDSGQGTSTVAVAGTFAFGSERV